MFTDKDVEKLQAMGNAHRPSVLGNDVGKLRNTLSSLSLSLSFRLLLACLFYYFQVANGIGRFADRRYHQPRKRESRVLNFLSIEALRRTVRRVLRNFDLLLLLLLLLSLAGRFRQRANCARRVHPVSSLCHMK